MRRFFAICLAISLILTMTIVSVEAQDVSPIADNYRTANATISISNGVANVSGSMQGIRGRTTKVTVHLYLQQYSDGEWIDYDDWLESVEGTSCTVNKNVAVPSGYKYRAKASCYAYAGSKCEHITKYSKTVSY